MKCKENNRIIQGNRQYDKNRGRENRRILDNKRSVQGCSLSPILFNTFLSDLEENMNKVQEGGVVIGREKVWTIVYANDIVLIATSEVEMKGMLRRFRM